MVFQMSEKCVPHDVMLEVEKLMVDTCYPDEATYAGDVTHTIKQVRLLLKNRGYTNEKLNREMERWLESARKMDEKELVVCEKMWDMMLCEEGED